MTRNHIAWGGVLAFMFGIFLARTPKTLDKSGDPLTPSDSPKPALETPRPTPGGATLERSKKSPTPTLKIPPEPAVPVSLEGLAQWALDHEEAMVACFEEASREGRHSENRAHIHMAAGPSRDGRTTLYLSVADTDEHLYDVEACLNQLSEETNLEPRADGTETGVMWTVSLPVEAWD